MNVLDLVQQDGHNPRYVSATYGGEWAMPCVRCNGRDRFRLWPNKGVRGGRFWCRQCSYSGDAISYVMDFRGMPYTVACKYLGLPTRRTIGATESSSGSMEFRPSVCRAAPSPLWRERAEIAVRFCIDQLWSESPMARRLLTWLRDERGLNDETIRTFELGLVPEDVYRCRASWGIERRDENNEESHEDGSHAV